MDRIQGVVTARRSSKEEHQKYQEWQKCREVFGKIQDEESRSIMFCHNTGQNLNVEDFIKKIEQKLNIALKDRTKFYSTQNNTISAIKIARFWMDNNLKRQVFTLLVRAGFNHIVGSNIDNAINSRNENPYT